MGARRALGRIVAGLVLGSVLCVHTTAMADFTEHVGEAIDHANAAAKHGRLGDAEMLAEHADGALRYAKEAQKLMPSPQLDRAITELEAAVAEGNAGHADQGVRHVDKALESLSTVK
jgi:hypothetical protein